MSLLFVEWHPPGGKRLRYPLADDAVSVGSDPGHQIRLKVDGVARHHISFRVHDDRVEVVPLPGVPEVRRNGEPLSGASEVHPGDHLDLGPLGLEVVDEEATAGADLFLHPEEVEARFGLPDPLSDTQPLPVVRHRRTTLVLAAILAVVFALTLLVLFTD